MKWLGCPVSFAPTDDAHCLDMRDWWLRQLCTGEPVRDAEQHVLSCFPHLARGNEALQRRGSPEFTSYDGYVKQAGLDLDPTEDNGPIMSSGRLETLGECPLKFFFLRGLQIELPEELVLDPTRWLDPLAAGQLLHEVFERFVRELIEQNRSPQHPEDFARLESILQSRAAEYRQWYPPPSEHVYQVQMAEFTRTIRTFLVEEVRYSSQTGNRPVFLEASLGMRTAGEGSAIDSDEPVPIPLPDGTSMRVRGRVDRIDEVGGSEQRSYVIWDYKTGSAWKYDAADPFRCGRVVQPALYVEMVRRCLKNAVKGQTHVTHFGFFFPGAVTAAAASSGRPTDWPTVPKCWPDSCRSSATEPFWPRTSRRTVSIAITPESVATPRRCRRLRRTNWPTQTTRCSSRSRSCESMGKRKASDTAKSASEKPVPPDQDRREAIVTQLDTTMLVEASAGAGKTRSMVDRMIALVSEGKCRVETLAAITFTRKAAAELRARFQLALEKAAREAQDATRQRLTHALDHVEQVFIGTIHSFCGRLLRERPVEAGVEPSFTELDEAIDARLKGEAWSEYVANRIVAADPILGELDEFGLRIGDLEQAFLRFATYPDVDEWPGEQSSLPDLSAAREALRDYMTHIESLLLTLPEDSGNDKLMPKLRLITRLFRQTDVTRPAELMELLAEFGEPGKMTVVQKNWPGKKAQALQELEQWEEFVANTAAPTGVALAAGTLSGRPARAERGGGQL